jgi:hypothetical protein
MKPVVREFCVDVFPTVVTTFESVSVEMTEKAPRTELVVAAVVTFA